MAEKTTVKTGAKTLIKKGVKITLLKAEDYQAFLQVDIVDDKGVKIVSCEPRLLYIGDTYTIYTGDVALEKPTVDLPMIKKLDITHNS